MGHSTYCSWEGCTESAVNDDGTCAKHGASPETLEMARQTLLMNTMRQVARKVINTERRERWRENERLAGVRKRQLRKAIAAQRRHDKAGKKRRASRKGKR